MKDWHLYGLVVISVILRILLFDMVYWDYENAISIWYNTLKTEGFSAFSRSFSDYSPLYLYFLYLLTFIPLPSLYSVKILSVIFDGFLAFVLSRIVFEITKNQNISKLSFVVLLLTPTVLMNSSSWGQCDSIYTSFILLSILSIIKQRYLLGYISLGIAFSFKLQSVFVFPAVAIITLNNLLYNKNIKFLFYPLLIPTIYVISIIPSYIAGRDIIDLLTIYLNQTKTYQDLTLGAPNIYTLFPKNLDSKINNIIFISGLTLSAIITITLITYFVIIYKKYKNIQNLAVILLFLMFSLIEPYLLPRMHDRYFYIADVLSLLFAFVFKDKWFLPVLVILSSTLAYIQVNILLGLSMVAIPLGVGIIWASIFSIKYLSEKNYQNLYKIIS